MSDDDPFAVVSPSEKKMSTYLKKSKEPNSRKCVETSSHGTNSTRSTATSTQTSDEVNFFAHTKILEKSSKHKSSSSSTSKANTNAFHNSSSNGSANFDFGDGLEFGQAFPDTPFGADVFEMHDQGGFEATQRKAQSSRNFKSSTTPFLPHPAGPKSMKNLSSTRPQDAFDAFGSDDPFKDMDYDGFGSFGHDSGENDGGGFFFQDDAFGNNAFAPSASTEEDGGFRREVLKTGESREPLKRGGSRENLRRGSRSRSGERPKRSASAKRRGANPRRNISSNELSIEGMDDGPSPRAASRKAPSGSSRKLDSEVVGGLNDASSSHKKRLENSPRRGDEHSPVRQTRGGVRPSRRSTMDYSGHTHSSDTKSHNSDDAQPRPRSSRRGPVSCAYSDGSLEPATIIKAPPPVRNNSLTGPPHRPASARRQRRASVTHTSPSDLVFMNQDIFSKSDHGDLSGNNDGWNNERSRNQEKIMDMTRGVTTLLNKSDHKSNDSSLDHIGQHFDMMALTTEESMDAGASRGRVRRGGKKEKLKDEEEYKEPKDRKDRTKGSLLDRLGAGGDASSSLNEIPSTSSRGKSQSSGLSYSDRIMLAQQRTKPN